MIDLSLVEFERLKLLLSGKTLSTEEQNSTLDILRSRFSNFFSNLEPGLTEENLKDNKFLIKYLTNPYNRNKIKNALQKELSLSLNQQIELVKILEEKPVTEEGVGGEVSGQGVSGQQEVPVSTTTGASAGGMPGMPSGPSISPAQRRVYRVPRAPKPEIHIANASGYVTEPGDASKLVRATSSGAVVEKPPSKIFVADRTGAVTGEHPIMPASAPKLPSRKKEKKRWFGRLRPGGSFNFLDLLSKRFANWVWRNALKPVLNFAWRSILQPALRWLAGQAGRLLFQFLPRLALGALNALAGLMGAVGGLAGITFAAGSALFWGVTAVVSFVAVTILATFLSPFINNPALEAPTPISSCQFVRGDRTPPGESYQSSFILDLFQNASKVTTVPPEVLAAIARVESPTVTSKTNADFPTLNSVAGCPKSPTGALGIMQIQPPDTTGYFAPGVELGASFLGKTADQLTEEDFCDVRNNIIVAGGFILKKLELRSKIGDGTKWDPAWNNDPDVINKLAEGYYGCLNYGGERDCEGPYNYGNDLWASIQSCQTTLIPGQITPPSADLQTLHDDILSTYKIDIGTSFPYDYLKWAWEKLGEASNTHFLQLVNPNNITISVIRDDSKINTQISCSKISMKGANSSGASYPEPLFKVVFIHELSHLIESCNLANSQKIKLQEEIIPIDGYLTNYSLNADQCVGANNVNEDYAETIAYFLNENYPEQSLGIGQACEPTQSKNPIYSGKKPYHRQFAIDLLLR